MHMHVHIHGDIHVYIHIHECYYECVILLNIITNTHFHSCTCLLHVQHTSYQTIYIIHSDIDVHDNNENIHVYTCT